MTRVAENQTLQSVLLGIYNNRSRVAKFSNEITSGYKVANPGDSNLSGSISQYRESLVKIEGYKNRVAVTKSSLIVQDNIMAEVTELMIRAKEIATQGANDANGRDARAQLSVEVFQIRDHLVQLANTTYQGRYLYGGADDDDPPIDMAAYAEPATGPESQRYVFDAEPGTDLLRQISLTDDLSITVNSSAGTLFVNALEALERLGRALSGYATNPATGSPDGTGAAYDFDNGGFEQQTIDLRNAIDLLDTARTEDISVERSALGGKLRRLDTAASLLELAKVNAEDVLDRLQNADIVESASNLAQAENALQASYTVSSRILSLSILDYI